MASYPRLGRARAAATCSGRRCIPRRRRYPHDATFNSTFELAVLGAGDWRRPSVARAPGPARGSRAWDRVLSELSAPAVARRHVPSPRPRPTRIRARDGPRIIRRCWRRSACCRAPMSIGRRCARTLDVDWADWDWPSTWGWDYPMMAMTAARLGEPDMAVDALLMDTPKNRYRANGHNYQRPGLTIYLPGNGGLLSAVAMMAAGWDGAPEGARARLSARRAMGGEVGGVETGAVGERASHASKSVPDARQRRRRSEGTNAATGRSGRNSKTRSSSTVCMTYSIYLDPDTTTCSATSRSRARSAGRRSPRPTSASGGGGTCATSCPPTPTPARCRATCGRCSTSDGDRRGATESGRPAAVGGRGAFLLRAGRTGEVHPSTEGNTSDRTRSRGRDRTSRAAATLARARTTRTGRASSCRS